jgi:hypothetical protein
MVGTHFPPHMLTRTLGMAARMELRSPVSTPTTMVCSEMGASQLAPPTAHIAPFWPMWAANQILALHLALATQPQAQRDAVRGHGAQ